MLELIVLRTEMVGAELLRRLPGGTWPAEAERVVDTLTLESIGLVVPLTEVYRTTRLAG